MLAAPRPAAVCGAMRRDRARPDGGDRRARRGARRGGAGEPGWRGAAGRGRRLGARRSSCCCRTPSCCWSRSCRPFTWTAEPLPAGARPRQLPHCSPSAGAPAAGLNSLWMAAAATARAPWRSGLAARAPRRRAAADGGRPRRGRCSRGCSALPWAIPGTVFAVALATTFSVDQPWLGRFVLVGTPWILPLAYLVRSLPLTGRAALAGLRQLDPALEEAAASLGAGRCAPPRCASPCRCCGPALAAGAGLAFITALGDFVVSIVLYTYDTRPISIEIHSSLRLQELGIGGGLRRAADGRERRGLPALGPRRERPEAAVPMSSARSPSRLTPALGPHGHGLRGHDRLPDGAAAAALLRQAAGRRAATVGALVSAFSFAQLATAPLWGRALGPLRPAADAPRRPALPRRVAFVRLRPRRHALAAVRCRAWCRAPAAAPPAWCRPTSPTPCRPEERAKALGWLTAATSAGVMIGPAARLASPPHFGEHAPGFVAAGLCLLNLASAWTLAAGVAA